MSRNLKPHIGIFGKRNIGKSSFINALTKEPIAIVSDQPGTTTDPVKKAYEITDIGPVVLIDTAGIDDLDSPLGKQRVTATMKVLEQVDLAILLFHQKLTSFEEDLINQFEKIHVPYFLVHHKEDLYQLKPQETQTLTDQIKTDIIAFSSQTCTQLPQLFDLIKKHLPESAYNNPSLLGDLVHQGDLILMITPIDIEAPKGRIILPQVQAIRDALDNDCVSIVLKEREVDTFLRTTHIKPKLAITDSQVFLKAAASVPDDIPLTSFSILFARLKGDFDNYIKGTPAIGQLKDNDTVLILESCSHHVAGDDIGRVKIPRWLSALTGKKLNFDILAGLNPPDKALETYSLVIQCGGCMLTRRQIINRLKPFVDRGIPVTNYGMAIAWCHGVFERAIRPFGKTSGKLESF